MSYSRAALLVYALTFSVVQVAAASHSLPLLDRSKVRAPLAVACNGGADGTGKPLPDDAPLPLHPPTLVLPGINRPGAAVQYNAYWIELHDAPGFRPNPLQRAQTCGEWRARVAAGQEFLETRQTFQLLGSARAFDDLWKAWGLAERPADFDQRVMRRYGLSTAKFRN